MFMCVVRSRISCPVQFYVFGGYDSQKNHNDLYVFDVNSMDTPRSRLSGQTRFEPH